MHTVCPCALVGKLASCVLFTEGTAREDYGRGLPHAEQDVVHAHQLAQRVVAGMPCMPNAYTV